MIKKRQTFIFLTYFIIVFIQNMISRQKRYVKVASRADFRNQCVLCTQKPTDKGGGGMTH